MNEVEHLNKIVRDQARMLQEKNLLLSELEYRLKKSVVAGSRKEDLAKFQLQLSRDTIEGQASLLKTILGSIPYGLMVVDSRKFIISYNRMAEEILGFSGREFLGKPCSNFLGQSCHEGCLLEEAIEKGEAQCSRKVTLSREEGRDLVLSLDVAPIHNSNGDVIGSVEVFSDITGAVAHENMLLEKHDSTVRVLARIMEKKDDYILAHSKRVKTLSLKLAEQLGSFGSEEESVLSYASLLHDIGLLSIPDEVLSAKRAGSDKPFNLIQAHPEEGELMLHSVDGFEEIKSIIRSHHERFDGKGYPDGLCGDKIPLASRIIGLVEAYDAMIHDQATPARSQDQVFEEIAVNRGSQFDPDLVDLFLSKVVGDAG